MEQTKVNNISFVKRLRDFYYSHEISAFVMTVAIVGYLIYLLAVYIPVLIVAILLAYLLDGIVEILVGWRCSRILAITATLTISVLSLGILILVAIPKLSVQISNFAKNIPDSLLSIENGFENLPDWLTENLEWDLVVTESGNYFKSAAESLVSSSVTNVAQLFTILVYMVLMPLLLFFLLRDKKIIINWIQKFIPGSPMLENLKAELDEQFGSYVRGKIIEAVIIFSLSLIAFWFIDVNYAFTLAIAIGLSVIIPFVGAVAVTFPVVLVGLLQFGLASEFWWLIGCYTVIQLLDGQVVVPLLFSEVVKIHPAAIFIAILIFGSIWGVWGVFFAIPLASLVKSVINVIERQQVATS